MPRNPPILKTRTFLLGVGAHKAGTTWLHDYFWSHPEVCISPVKEMHFFGNRQGDDPWPDSMFRKKLAHRVERDLAKGREPDHRHIGLRERIEMGRDLNLYRKFFRRRLRDHPVFGEITPAYGHLPREELQVIKDIFSRTKVIYLLRNPADRLWSHMRFSLKYNDLADLEAKLPGITDRPAYAERCGYAKTLDNLEAVFGMEAVHVAFYEELFTQPAIVEICRFLGVRAVPANFDKALNVSNKMPMGAAQRQMAIEMLRPQYKAVIERFGDRVPESWHHDFNT